MALRSNYLLTFGLWLAIGGFYKPAIRSDLTHYIYDATYP